MQAVCTHAAAVLDPALAEVQTLEKDAVVMAGRAVAAVDRSCKSAEGWRRGASSLTAASSVSSACHGSGCG